MNGRNTSLKKNINHSMTKTKNIILPHTVAIPIYAFIQKQLHKEPPEETIISKTQRPSQQS